MYPGGNALNFSVYARMLGARSAYLGVFGDDAAAAHIREVLKALDVATERCHIEQGENGYANVVLVDGNRTFESSNTGGIARRKRFIPSTEDLAYVSGFDLVHTGCTSQLDDQLGAIRGAAQRVSYDFSWRWQIDGLVETVCPHIDLAAFSCGDAGPEKARELIDRASALGVGLVIATLGGAGALASNGHERAHVSAKPVDIVDTLGAGDAFLTTLLLSLLRSGWTRGRPISSATLQRAMEDGAAFAARICMLDGAFGHGAPFPQTEAS
jgi:sugar/nucleoside kinase (ribokinase family)